MERLLSLELRGNEEQEKVFLPGLGQIITTKKKLDACNIVKRIIQTAGYDPQVVQLVQLTDAVDCCNWLQRNFDSFQGAKNHFGVTAKSWHKLADKLNEKNSKVY